VTVPYGSRGKGTLKAESEGKNKEGHEDVEAGGGSGGFLSREYKGYRENEGEEDTTVTYIKKIGKEILQH